MAQRNPSQRLKGQETTILWTQDSVLQATLTDIQNFNVELKFELKEQGYLGEPTNRYDEIFNGCSFDMELNIHTQDFFNFRLAIKQRAQRITPDVMFNITSVFQFPNGQTPVQRLPDVFFGPNPTQIASRGDYVKIKLAGGCNDESTQTS
jgi:hypothetical protein